MTDKQATEIVLKLKETTRVDDLCVDLDMAKMTMYKRLRTGKWKETEKALIKTL